MANESNLVGGKTLEDLRREQAQLQSKPALPILNPHQKTEQEKKYWDTVFASAKAKSNGPIMRRFSQSVSYETARGELLRLFQLKEAAEASRRGEAVKFSFTAQQGSVVAGLLKWFTNAPDSPYPIGKGIFLYGDIGAGKTELIRSLCDMAEVLGLDKKFQYASMSAVYSQAEADSSYSAVPINAQFDRVLDEFGRRTGAVTNYGNAIDLNESIIEARYNRFQGYGQLTIFISNAPLEAFRDMLTGMAFDRLRHMATPVLYPGGSKRG